MAIVISGVNNNDKITASDGTIDLLSGVNYIGIVTAPSITASNNITAGNLNIGSNIQLGNAGVATATTFVGNLTGNVNATSNLLLQIGGSEKFRVASSGQLGIGGANYGTSGQVLTSGGSGSAATWSTISGTTINNNADNRVITGSGTANTLEGEANLTFNGGVTGDAQLTVHAAEANANSDSELILETSNDFATSAVMFKDTTGEAGSIAYNHGDNYIKFSTNGTDGGIERVRITSSGTLNIGGATQTTHLLYLQSTGDASIHLAADTDNVTEDHNPSISMSQDGGGASQMFKIGMEAGDGAEFSQSIGNGCYIHANNSSSQPLQLAHMDNLAVTISSVHGSHFHTYGGNTVAGVKIANRGNDTAAALLLQGHNNSGGTPGQATNFQITHKGANATTNFRHLGTDRLVIGSTGVVSGDLNDTSDIALKKDIESISTSCIDNIKQLNPVTFKWRDTSRKDIGFIAQEVEVILPDLVNGEDGVKSINTIGLVSQLTKALQEAITEIETLKTKVAALEGS